MKRQNLILLAFFLTFSCIKSATITSTAAGGAFNAGGSWIGGVSPANGDSVVIQSTATITIGVTDTCKSIRLAGNLRFTANATIRITNELYVDATGQITTTAASATRDVQVEGLFTISAGANLSIPGIDFRALSTSLIDGTLTLVTSNTGAKTLTGNVTMGNGSSIVFSINETLTLSNALICNGTNSILFSAAGVLSSSSLTINGSTTLTNNAAGSYTSGNSTVNGTYNLGGTVTGTFTNSTTLGIAGGATVNVGDINLAVNGLSTIDGTINFTSVNGSKTFAGFTINASGNWNCGSIDESFTISGNITNNGTFTAGSSAAAGNLYTITGTRIATGTFTFQNLSTAALTNNGTINVTNALAGTTFTQGATGVLNLDISDANFTLATLTASASGNTVNYEYAGSQTIRSGPYHNLTLSKSGTKSLNAATVVNGNLLIAGAANLDVTASNRSLTVNGNWTVTSTDSDPFIERNGTVTFSGTLTTQTISTPLTQETFFAFTVNNSSGLNPGVITNKDIMILSIYNHTNGIFDLTGHDINVVSAAGNGIVTCTLSGGSIISSVAGSSVSFTDADDSTYVNFSGTDVGSAVMDVNLSVNTGKVCVGGLELYGTGDFTKTLASDDVCGLGNNKFRRDVAFTATNSASRWRFGDNGNPDTCFAEVRFNAFANGGSNNNFIIGVSSLGNCYYDSVFINSTTSGGFYIGRSNGGTANSHTFKGPVEVNVSLTGNVTFAEATANVNTCTFESTLRLNSLVTSTGDINIGASNANSIITFTNTGRLIDGTILGATNINFYHVTQNGALAQSTLSSASTNSIITVGSLAAPCIWNGNLTLTSPNINLAYSTFNGTTNVFTSNGSANQNCTGGNTFNGTTNTFINAGTGYWRLASTAGDDYNSNVEFRRTSTGDLQVAYNNNNTFSGNITSRSTIATDSVEFGTGNGVVIFDGTTNQTYTNVGTKNASFERVTINNTSGDVTLNSTMKIITGGTFTLTSGKLNTTAANILELMDETTTTTIGNASSFVNGPMKYLVSTGNAGTVINFPLGKGSDWNPAVLTLDHAAATEDTYTAELFNSSAMALGYTFGSATIDTVSRVHYWQIDRTSNGTITTGQAQLYYQLNDDVDDPANLRIAKTNGAGTSWFDIGGTGTAAGAGSITSTTNFTTFSKFTLADRVGGSNPLPVELLEFTGKKCNNDVCLDWLTATELNNDRFEVEKSSNALDFTVIGNVKSKALNGNSNSQLSYSFTDTEPFEGTNYYRLNQFDINGTSKYSNIISVSFLKSNTISFVVYPNPNNGVFNVDFSGLENNQELCLILKDALGKVVYEKVVSYYEFKNGTIRVNPGENISSGVYYLKIIAAGDDQVIKIFINK